MTKVINGNSYEFPSVDMHRTIINKLIMNDAELFRDFFQHIKQEYMKHEKAKLLEKLKWDTHLLGFKAIENVKNQIHHWEQS